MPAQAVEVVAGPLTVYVAAVGTAMPAVDTAPSGSWTKLGTYGTRNYEESGVIVETNQTIAQWRTAGGTLARKAYRTAEDVIVRFMLADLSSAQYAKVLNDAAITTAPASTGVPGTKKFSLVQGKSVALFALVARGVSPVDPALSAQWELPVAYNSGSPKPAFVKGAPAALECIWTALEADDGSLPGLTIQTAVAS